MAKKRKVSRRAPPKRARVVRKPYKLVLTRLVSSHATESEAKRKADDCEGDLGVGEKLVVVKGETA